MNIFTIIDDLSNNKKNLFVNSDNPDLVKKTYNSFMVNRFFSYFPDTCLLANEMNKSHIDPRMQHDFYLYSTRKRKRFSKWFKPQENEDLNIIARYYKCNLSRAKEIMNILNDSQKQIIKNSFYEGGIVK